MSGGSTSGLLAELWAAKWLGATDLEWGRASSFALSVLRRVTAHLDTSDT